MASSSRRYTLGVDDVSSAFSEILESRRYRIRRSIARGAMSSVYEAVQYGVEGFEKTVTVKTLRRAKADDPEMRRLFVGEAKLVADLVHENIVQVYHLGTVSGVYYMAMEFVDGVNLDRFIARHRELGRDIPAEIATFIVSRVCRGLEYAHTKAGRDGKPLRIVHRDICPKNVMINSEGVVKVTDFGVAKARRLMEQRDEVPMGSLEYMSPEQIRGEATDARSDLFSLGAVFYELLTGRTLFSGATVLDVVEAIRKGPLPSPGSIRPDLPDEVGRIMLHALERDPHLRYPAAGEMGYALEHFMYHDRFGPTNVTLGRYMKELFPKDDSSS